ncbi:MAG: SIR2 family protein [Nitrospira sp.]|nr:SIR2 family protein [Nitrospira sp.]
MEKVIFLLGAGASVDAGMPMVTELTKELAALLPTLPDMNGTPCPAYKEAFDDIAAHDPSVAENYERFFEWVKLIRDVEREPFRRIINTRIRPELVESLSHLPFVLCEAIAHLLCSRHAKPCYLAKLADFVPSHGRLKVFSLNYDCCVEEACRLGGIDWTTGFDPTAKTWSPNLFQSQNKGINLYKLHGSLHWFMTQDTRTRSVEPQNPQVLMELSPTENQHLPSCITVGWEKPELVLGPGSKIQPDDPFLSLLYEFRCSIKRARTCVVIGYSYKDKHINALLDSALDDRVNILDVNLSNPNGHYIADTCYKHLRFRAREAFEEGIISKHLMRN